MIGPDAAVEGQFAHGGEIAQLLGQQLSRGDEQSQGDRQIESAGIFAEVGRGKIDYRAARMAIVAKIGQSPFDAVGAFANGQFRQADQHGFRQPGRCIHLDLDRHRVDADQCKGV